MDLRKKSETLASGTGVGPVGMKICRVLIPVSILFIWAFWGGIAPFENDIHYLIAQGREILELGHCPEYNSWVYFDDFKIVVQNWAYAVTCALMYDTFGNWGILVLGAAQALLVVWAVKLLISLRVRDGFWAWIGAVISCAMILGYWRSSRLENLTVAMLIFSVLCMEKYRTEKRPFWLYIRIIFVIIEMQFQASMWPMHFCVFLAYITPCLIGKPIDDRLRLDKHVILSTILMIAALFVNPYGIDGVLYIIRAMGSLDGFNILEQQPLYAMRDMLPSGAIMSIAWVAGVVSGKLRSSTVYLAGGFLVLSFLKAHASMFYPIVFGVLYADLFSCVQDKFEKQVREIIPGYFVGIWAALTVFLGILTVGFKFPIVETADVRAGLDPIVEYIQSHESSNVICGMNSGSYLIFKDIYGIYTDSRPELLDGSINKCFDATEDNLAFRISDYDFLSQDRYNNLLEYLELYDIGYVVDGYGNWVYSWLVQCLSKSGNWVEAVKPEGQVSLKDDKFVLYVRKDIADGVT